MFGVDLDGDGEVGESHNLDDALKADLEAFHLADTEEQIRAREEQRAKRHLLVCAYTYMISRLFACAMCQTIS
jgi:hypothetical protein